MADVIKFEFDQPVEVALRFTEPRVFPSQFAGGDDRHMFSTTDGRVMYVTPLTSARIKALSLTQGELFWICKRKNNRITEFSVTRETMEPTQAVAPKPTRPPALFKSNLPERVFYTPPVKEHEPPSPLEEQLRASIAMVERRKAGEQGDGTLAVMAPPPPAKPAEPRIAPAAAEPAWVGTLIDQTNHLVDAFAASLAHASKSHGNAVKADDIRSLLVTSFIQLAQKENRNAA